MIPNNYVDEERRSVTDHYFKPIPPPAVRVTIGGPINLESLPDFAAPLRAVPD